MGLFYRIQAIDKDGKISYSEVRKISYNHFNHSISVYPNPSNGKVCIDFPISNGQCIVMVVDVFGKKIFEKKYGSNETKVLLNISASKGIYLLSITDNKTTVTKKIIIQ